MLRETSNRRPVADETVWVVVVSHPGKEHAVRTKVVRVLPVPIGIQMLVQRIDNREIIDFIIPDKPLTQNQDKLVFQRSGDWRLSTMRSMKPYHPVAIVHQLFGVTPEDRGRPLAMAAV